MKKILSIIANGMEDGEFVITNDLLVRAGYQIEYYFANHNSNSVCTSKQNLILDFKNQHVAHPSASNYDALILPGGPGIRNYSQDVFLKKLVTDMLNKGKLVAAICAAPQILISWALLENYSFTGFPKIEEITGHPNYQNLKVVESNNLITSQALGTTFLFALKIIHYLSGEDLTYKIKNEIFY